MMTDTVTTTVGGIAARLSIRGCMFNNASVTKAFAVTVTVEGTIASAVVRHASSYFACVAFARTGI